MSLENLIENNAAIDARTTNKKIIQDLLNDPAVESLTIPEGTYYIAGALELSSNTEFCGESQKKTILVIDDGIRSIFYKTNPSEGKGIQNVTLSRFTLKATEDDQLHPPIDILSEDLRYYKQGNSSLDFSYNNFSFIDISNQYKEPSTTATGELALPNKGIMIESVTIDGLTKEGYKGDSGIAIRNASDVTIQNCVIQNIGEKNGITIQECQQVTIQKNKLSDLGRSGIFIYFRNKDITILNNTVSDWLQRFGALHYVTTYFTHENGNGPEPETNSDSGIYSYGPMNEEITIRQNDLSVLTKKINPCNPAIDGFRDELKLPDPLENPYALYAGIRSAGSYNTLVEQNTVLFNAVNILGFFVGGAKQLSINGTETIFYGVKGLIVRENSFRLQSKDLEEVIFNPLGIMYPMRLFNIEQPDERNVPTSENNVELIGALIDANEWVIMGIILNQYDALVEVRLGEEGHSSDTKLGAVSFTNNHIAFLSTSPTQISQMGTLLSFNNKDESNFSIDYVELWGTTFSNDTFVPEDLRGTRYIQRLTRLAVTTGSKESELVFEGNFSTNIPATGMEGGLTGYTLYQFSGSPLGASPEAIEGNVFSTRLPLDTFQSLPEIEWVFGRTKEQVDKKEKRFIYEEVPKLEVYYPTSEAVKGTIGAYTKDVDLFIQGESIGTVKVVNGTFTFPTAGLGLTTVGQLFEVASIRGERIGPKAFGIVMDLNAPTVSPYIVGEEKVEGTVAGNPPQIALFTDGQLRYTAAVRPNGTYELYIKNFDLLPVGKHFEMAALKDGVFGPKTPSEVLPIRNLVAPTIDRYYTDNAYAYGTIGGDATQVALFINGVQRRTAAVTDGKYSIYTGDFGLTTAGKSFEIAGINGPITGPKTTGIVMNKPTLVAPVIHPYYTTDAYANGTIAGDAIQVALFINGVQKRTAAVTDGKYTIYTGDLGLTTVGQSFEIAGINGSMVGPKTTATVLRKPVLLAPTIDRYYASDAYAAGTIGGEATQVAIFINGIQRRTAAVTDGKYSIYTGDLGLTTPGASFEIGGIASGVIGPKTKGVVLDKALFVLTADAYTLVQDSMVEGTRGSGIDRVFLYVEGVEVKSNRPTTEDYQLYAEDAIKSVTQLVEVVGKDSTGVEVNRVKVDVKNLDPTSYALTAKDYTLGKDMTVEGTRGSAIVRVVVVVDGVEVRSNRPTTEDYQLYVVGVIKSTTQKVEVIGYNDAGKEVNRINVNVIEVPTTPLIVTPNEYTLGQDTVTGTISSNVIRVALLVNGESVRTTTTTGTTFEIWAKDKITQGNKNQISIVATDAYGRSVAAPVVVK